MVGYQSQKSSLMSRSLLLPTWYFFSRTKQKWAARMEVTCWFGETLIHHRYRTTSGFWVTLVDWSLGLNPMHSPCPLVFYHSASWNLPYPREEWGRAAICALCTPTVGSSITPHTFHRLHAIGQTLLMSSPGDPETVATQSQWALPVNVPSCPQSTRGCIALPRSSSAVKYEDRRFLCKWALFLCPQVLCPSCLLVVVCESSRSTLEEITF